MSESSEENLQQHSEDRFSYQFPASEEQGVKPVWNVVWTHSNFESIVCEQLSAKGYRLFLPMIESWSKSRTKSRRRVPMFSSYAFIHHAIDKYDYLNICKTKGVVDLLGSRWDRLATIPAHEIESIRLATSNPVPCIPYSYLKSGDRVRISKGPLKDVEGILVRTNEKRGLLVLTVDLLRRSIAVEVDCRYVSPA